MALMQSVSGLRGIVGSSFTPDVISRTVASFGLIQRSRWPDTGSKPVLLVGRDSRVSGPWVEHIVVGILAAQGYDVHTLGIVPTPTVQLLVIKEKAVGGLIITSSHNPVEWNGLKFVDHDGLFLSPDLCKSLYAQALDSQKLESSYVEWNKAGQIHRYDKAVQSHLDSIFGLSYIQPETVQFRKYKVCLDAINGAGGEIMTRLLEQMGCQVIGINLEPTGIFNHEPEPVPSNLTQLCDSVKQHKADFGIAVDPDVDRCVLVDEHGEPIGEEYTLAIAVNYMLAVVGRRGPIVKNLSSSRVVDDIASKYEGCPVHATPVGEIHVATEMVKVGAIIGGEGNGGVMLPDVHIGRDAPVAAALVLMQLAVSGMKMSEFKATLPQWEIVKLKTPAEGLNVSGVFEALKEEWVAKGATISESDGLRIDSDQFWVHLRTSNTEPIVRVIGESGNLEKAKLTCSDFMMKIQSLGSSR